MSRIVLPEVLFLSGPRLACRQLGAAIEMHPETDACAFSFYEPLRLALLGLFYQGDPGLDPHEASEIPSLEHPMKHGHFLLSLHHFMNQKFGPKVLGELAVQRIEADRDYYETFVIDDCGDDLIDDMKHVAEKVGPDRCAFVLLLNTDDRSTFSFPSGVRVIQLRMSPGDTNLQIFASLISALDEKSTR